MTGHTLKIKINPGKLEQVAERFADRKLFIRLVTAIDAEDSKTAQAILYDLHGLAGARHIVAILESGFASCDEVAELLKPPHPRAG